MTLELIKEFEEMESCQFDYAVEAKNVTALFGFNDTTIDCKEEYLKYYTDFASFDGDNQLSHENIENVLIPLIKEKLAY